MLERTLTKINMMENHLSKYKEIVAPIPINAGNKIDAKRILPFHAAK
jgi:hypothetical protein